MPSERFRRLFVHMRGKGALKLPTRPPGARIITGLIPHSVLRGHSTCCSVSPCASNTFWGRRRQIKRRSVDTYQHTAVRRSCTMVDTALPGLFRPAAPDRILNRSLPKLSRNAFFSVHQTSSCLKKYLFGKPPLLSAGSCGDVQVASSRSVGIRIVQKLSSGEFEHTRRRSRNSLTYYVRSSQSRRTKFTGG